MVLHICNTSIVMQRQVKPCGVLASQPQLNGKLQAQCRDPVSKIIRWKAIEEDILMSISDTHKHIHGYTFPHAHQYAYPPPLTLSHTQMVILTGDGNDGGSDDDLMMIVVMVKLLMLKLVVMTVMMMLWSHLSTRPQFSLGNR